MTLLSDQDTAILERIAVALEKIAAAVAPIELGQIDDEVELSSLHETLASLTLDGIELAVDDRPTWDEMNAAIQTAIDNNNYVDPEEL